jgi:hypothetical protein
MRRKHCVSARHDHRAIDEFIHHRRPSIVTDDEFISAFESCQLPRLQWTHHAHVRVAYLYASQHDWETAIDRMRRGIQAYNKATATPETIDRGYHETITQAFLRLVFAAQQRTGPHETAEHFCEAHPELLSKYVLQTFYSRERLMTMEAKADFVEPELRPLPDVVGHTEQENSL